ncbi:MAG: hypothetical protein LBR58_03615 [Propionibacteriaceae bacterium]|jgi:hypothetical protein|nr:hypothetical protein [Propionibacteriaceae bacterium]
MTSLLRPVGSKSAGTYWVRRLVLVIPVLLVVGLAVWLIGSGDEGAVGEPVESPVATGPAACNSANVSISIVAIPQIKTSAPTATFVISLVNDAEHVCVMDVSNSNTEITIVSGKDQIWSTADCDEWITAGKQSVDQDDAYEITLDWKLRRSSSSCKHAKAELKPGTYQIKVAWQSATGKKSFLLV